MATFTLGENVRLFRERLAWTETQLAARAGIGQPAVSLIENGQRPNPGIATLQKIARALRVSIGDLLGQKPAKSVRRRKADPLLEQQIADLDQGLAATNKALGQLAQRVQAQSAEIKQLQRALKSKMVR
ncbi:MAG: family transcriptional regulator [Candidatus Eremiobacteraeota bacterium]|nr:family transcriptional regulator [Candidatus Eremiobacteraeota bacterium]